MSSKAKSQSRGRHCAKRRAEQSSSDDDSDTSSPSRSPSSSCRSYSYSCTDSNCSQAHSPSRSPSPSSSSHHSTSGSCSSDTNSSDSQSDSCSDSDDTHSPPSKTRTKKHVVAGKSKSIVFASVPAYYPTPTPCSVASVPNTTSKAKPVAPIQSKACVVVKEEKINPSKTRRIPPMNNNYVQDHPTDSERKNRQTNQSNNCDGIGGGKKNDRAPVQPNKDQKSCQEECPIPTKQIPCTKSFRNGGSMFNEHCANQDYNQNQKNCLEREEQCLKGSRGRMGPMGKPGIRGPSGPSGLRGATGISGASGLRGASGLTGVSGPSGLVGITGASGLSGVTGASGASGLQGVSGLQGLTGATGVSGIGIQGPPGPAGPSGAPGICCCRTKKCKNIPESECDDDSDCDDDHDCDFNCCCCLPQQQPLYVNCRPKQQQPQQYWDHNNCDFQCCSSSPPHGNNSCNYYCQPPQQQQQYQDDCFDDDHDCDLQLGCCDDDHDCDLQLDCGEEHDEWYHPESGRNSYEFCHQQCDDDNHDCDFQCCCDCEDEEDQCHDDFDRCCLISVTGPTGASGIRGLPGASGVSGLIGATGASGLVGATGPKGNTGCRGVQGPRGCEGKKGKNGYNGLDGKEGPRGRDGLPGKCGPTGPAGPPCPCIAGGCNEIPLRGPFAPSEASSAEVVVAAPITVPDVYGSFSLVTTANSPILITAGQSVVFAPGVYTAPGITYDDTTGAILVMDEGDYELHYGATTTAIVRYGIRKNGSSTIVPETFAQDRTMATIIHLQANDYIQLSHADNNSITLAAPTSSYPVAVAYLTIKKLRS